MGTTQRMTPGVSGEPNWGDLNKSITNISKTVEKENELENNINITSQDEAKQYKQISDRRSTHLKSTFKNLVKTGGGRSNISSGKSPSIGKAGIKSSVRIAVFLQGLEVAA